MKLNAKKRFCVVNRQGLAVYNQEEDVLQDRKILLMKFDEIVSNVETRPSDGALIVSSNSFKVKERILECRNLKLFSSK